MLIRLTTPDRRICRWCHGVGWYYVETPDENRPLYAVLRRCVQPHVHQIHVQDGANVSRETSEVQHVE